MVITEIKSNTGSHSPSAINSQPPYPAEFICLFDPNLHVSLSSNCHAWQEFPKDTLSN